MRSAVEISMYPLTGDYRPLIQAFHRSPEHAPGARRANQFAEHADLRGALDRVMAILAEEIERSAAARPAADLRHEGAAGVGAAVIAELSVQLASAWRSTSWIEILAAVLAVAYLLLAIRQSIGCWAAAFVSSCLYVWVLFGARLYMESVLNGFYAAMAVYGYWQWRGSGGGAVAATCIAGPGRAMRCAAGGHRRRCPR